MSKNIDTETKFPNDIDDRLYFNDAELQDVTVMKQYRSLLTDGKIGQAAELLENSGSFFYGAWILNRFGNQVNKIGAYLKAKQETYENVPKLIISQDCNPKITTEKDVICNGHKYKANNWTTGINIPHWASSKTFDWTVTYYSDSNGTYVFDPYDDRAYISASDPDGYYYLDGAGTKYWKDHSYTTWRPYYIYPNTSNKYYLTNRGVKVLYSQEPNHVYDYPYFADNYYDTGEKIYTYKHVDYYLNDGNKYDTAPSTNLNSYFYFTLDINKRMIEKDSKMFIKSSGLKYYVSSDDYEWILNDDEIYQRISENTTTGEITYEQVYRTSYNNSSTQYYIEDGHKYKLDSDGRKYWTDNWGTIYYYNEDWSYYYLDNNNVQWDRDEEGVFYRTNDEGVKEYRDSLNGQTYYIEEHMNHKYYIDANKNWISYDIHGAAETIHYVSKTDGRIYITVNTTTWWYDETRPIYYDDAGNESENPLSE